MGTPPIQAVRYATTAPTIIAISGNQRAARSVIGPPVPSPVGRAETVHTVADMAPYPSMGGRVDSVQGADEQAPRAVGETLIAGQPTSDTGEAENDLH